MNTNFSRHPRSHRRIVRGFGVCVLGAALAVLAGCSSSTTGGVTSPTSSSTPSSQTSSASQGTASSSSGSSGGSTSGSDTAINAMIPQNIRDKGYISNVMYNNAVPNEYMENGKLTGLQPDFVAAIQQVIGIEIRTTPVGSFDSMIPGIQSGRYEVSFGGLAITQARLKVVDMVSYYQQGMIFATLAQGDLTIKTGMDLCGKRVGTVAGTVFIPNITKLSGECTGAGKPAITNQTYPSHSDMVSALLNQRIDTYGDSTANTSSDVKNNDKLKLQEFVFAPTLQGLAVPQGSELGPVFQAAFKKLIEDGTYQKILEKWQLTQMAVSTDEVQVNPSVSS